MAISVSKRVKPLFFKKLGIIAKYTVFIVLFLSFLLIFSYVFFPYGELRTPLEAAFYKNTRMRLTVKKIYYGFPFYINFKAINSEIFYANRARLNISPAVLLDYIIFKKILLNVNFYGVRALKTGGRGINLKYARANLSVDMPGNGIYGDIIFNGDAKGRLEITKALLTPFTIDGAVLRLKPDAALYKQNGVLFKTLFKRDKNGYFVYYLNDFRL